MTSLEHLHLPIYESLHQDDSVWEVDRFLTPDELVSQTHAFMQTFVQRSLEGTLPDVIFFLDKGARKIGEMFDMLFSTYCPNVPKPQIEYINFGRARLNADQQTVIPFRGDPAIIHQHYGLGEPHRILVVDDYSETNDTRWKAQRSIQQAYPTTQVTSTVVYNKIPGWQGISDYAGVEEYTSHDYYLIALQRLNEEITSSGIHFESLDDLYGYLGDNPISYRFHDIYQELSGTIPVTKPLRRSRFSLDAISQEVQQICNAVVALQNK